MDHCYEEMENEKLLLEKYTHQTGRTKNLQGYNCDFKILYLNYHTCVAKHNFAHFAR